MAQKPPRAAPGPLEAFLQVADVPPRDAANEVGPVCRPPTNQDHGLVDEPHLTPVETLALFTLQPILRAIPPWRGALMSYAAR